MDTKKWWKSKTLWVNGIAIGGIFLSSNFGFQMDPEESVAILGVLNMVLRGFTKSGLG